MTNFLIALQFLTVIPVRLRYVDEKKIRASLIYFPLIGALLGLILTGAYNILSFLNFKDLSADSVLIVLLLVLTGGMHLDGLADTMDAFSSRKNKEEMLRIMRDSRIGAMGVLAVVSVILLKIAFLLSISAAFKAMALISMCILSRWSLVMSMFMFPYARQDGKARDFIQGADLKTFIVSTVIALVCMCVIWGAHGLWAILMAGAFTAMISVPIKNRIGGITGDTLGATSEIMEVMALFFISLLERIGT